jgi:hypothetical protein
MFKDTTYSDFPSTIDATYWNTTANHLNNGVTTSTPTTTEETAAATYTRGTLAQQWQIEIAGHAAATVFVERDYPFYLVIENLQAYLNENGDYSEEWEEEDELTSTESTVITPPEEQTRTQLETPAFSAGPDPDPVTRPTDVSTNEGMDQAAEARHTESQRYLKSIKEATEAGVNQTASAAGTAHNDAISIRSAAEAAGTAAADAAEGAGNQVTGAINTAAGTAHADAEGIKDALTELGGEPGGDDGMGDDDPGGFNDANAAAAAATSGLQAALSGLADEVAAFTAIFSTSITGASFPVVTLPIPGMLGGGTLVFDFGDYSDWWNLLRGILLIVAGWGFASAILENIRQAVS